MEQPNKRQKLSEYSGKGSSTRRPSLASKHRNQPRGQAKVVNFSEAQDHRNGDSVVSTNGNQDRSSSANPPTSINRLKQRSRDLTAVRQQLPIWPHADEIRSKLINNDVLLLVGETGSGKSTQIPQFLLDRLCKRTTVKNGVKVGGTIAITQPRRVAAISLARRVAEEMGTPLGNSSPASQVGYSVRFDSSVSPSTRIKFLTDGMLLQELLRDPWLKEYSVVVVDEVHERGLNVDLVLGFLKRLIEGRDVSDGRGGVPLKVVVMSATADMERIESFFTRPDASVRGSTANGRSNNAVEEWDGFSSGDEVTGVSQEVKEQVTIKVASCFIKGRQYPVKIHYTPQAIPNALDAALERIMHIHTHTPLPGDILVFLPGQETIDSLELMCNNYAQTLFTQSKQKGAPRLPKLLILPLFAALPTAAQQRVFESTPPFTRKIILSTNIAETSVTVPGIRHVIDSGKRKARFFRPSLNLNTLLSKPISRSSANQRAGRAGREAPGNCYRLYTEKTFYELTADTEPEILRCDLSQLVLTLKSFNVDNVLTFPLLTPAPNKALERALLHLLRLRALDRQTGQVNTLGRQMSKLPLPANLARILLASSHPYFDCKAEIIDIVSGLSVENIWLPIHKAGLSSGTSRSEDPLTSINPQAAPKGDDDEDEQQNPIAQARSTLYRREGDHLTLLAAIQAYSGENSDRKEWCRRHGISHRAMKAAMDVRKQLTNILSSQTSSDGKGGKLSKVKSKSKSKSNSRLKNEGMTADSSVSITTNNNNDNDTNHNNDDDNNNTDNDDKDNNDQTPHLSNNETNPLPHRILQCLLQGLSENVARLSSSSSSNPSNSTSQIWTGPYRTFSPGTETKNLQIHPSSVLFNRGSPSTNGSNGNRPAMIMFNEFVVTGRAYASGVSEIRAEWLDQLLFES